MNVFEKNEYFDTLADLLTACDFEINTNKNILKNGKKIHLCGVTMTVSSTKGTFNPMYNMMHAMYLFTHMHYLTNISCNITQDVNGHMIIAINNDAKPHMDSLLVLKYKEFSPVPIFYAACLLFLQYNNYVDKFKTDLKLEVISANIRYIKQHWNSI